MGWSPPCPDCRDDVDVEDGDVEVGGEHEVVKRVDGEVDVHRCLPRGVVLCEESAVLGSR